MAPCQTGVSNLPLSRSNSNQYLYQIVKPILIELGAAIAINAAVIAFFPATLSVTLITAGLVSYALPNLIYTVHAIYNGIITSEKDLDGKLRKTQLLSRLSLANIMGAAGPNLIIHEAGHALAAYNLFKNARPRFWIRYFEGGATTYTISNKLTALGSLLGKQHCILLIAAAGVIASTIFVMFEMTASRKLGRQHSILSEYMKLHAISYLFNEVCYGLTAFRASKKDLGHDFVCLWQKGGIHPLVPITAMIVLPVLFGSYLFFNSDRQKAA